jgi:hypothetical protein
MEGNMSLPTPDANEKRKDFINRFMKDPMVSREINQLDKRERAAVRKWQTYITAEGSLEQKQIENVIKYIDSRDQPALYPGDVQYILNTLTGVEPQ